LFPLSRYDDVADMNRVVSMLRSIAYLLIKQKEVCIVKGPELYIVLLRYMDGFRTRLV
jgi:hypothetical protein